LADVAVQIFTCSSSAGSTDARIVLSGAMAATKRRRSNENTSPCFSNLSGPYIKRVRRVFNHVSETELQDIQNKRITNEAIIAEAQKVAEAAAANDAEEKLILRSKKRVAHVLTSVSEIGYGSLAEFLIELMATKDWAQLSQVSQMLIKHRERVLDHIRERQPAIMNAWAVRVSGEALAKEGKKLAEYLHPAQGQEVSEVLANFSLERILVDAEKMAPNFCMLR
jgi:hypothetical protein